jgi:hypothetical protein
MVEVLEAPQVASAARRFLLAFVPTLTVAAIYWLIVITQAPSLEAARYTLLSNIALTVFYPIVIPFVAGALAAVVHPQELIGRTPAARAILAGLIVLVLGAALYVLVADSEQALNDRVIEPIEFKTREMRAFFFDVNERLRQDPTSAGASLECQAPMTDPYWASKCYMDVTQARFGKDANGQNVTITLRQHMGLASWWQRVLSAQSLVVGSVLLISLLALHIKGYRDARLLDALLVSLGLTILWIPFRVFSDWYIHFRSFATLYQYSLLGIGSIVLLVALLATYFRRAVGEPSKLFSIVVGSTATIASVVAAFRPELLGPVANFVGSMPIGFVVVFEVIVLMLLYVMVGPAVEPDS